MNPNWAGLFYQVSSDSSDEEYEMLINNINQQKQGLYQIMLNNNKFVCELLKHQNIETTHGGSIPGHRMVYRDREAADQNLYNDYFAENPTFNESSFRRRYRMSRSLFLCIVDAVKNHDGYFMQRRDAAGRLGLSTLQKITDAFRILAYAVPADATDEYIKIGESTAIECVKRFCRAVVEIFSVQYLRSPTTNDVARLLQIGEKHGFPGMLGSLDCMHWKWKNCPTAWAGQYA